MLSASRRALVAVRQSSCPVATTSIQISSSWPFGVKPLSRIARDAGLAIGDSGGIAVSPSLRTSDPDIYAVGDVIEVTHTVSGAAAAIPLAGPAHQQARIAATNIAGMSGGWGEQVSWHAGQLNSEAFRPVLRLDGCHIGSAEAQEHPI